MAYNLRLSTKLSRVHNVFHVSMLQKYVLDPSHIFQEQPLDVKKNLTYKESLERPLRVLDKKDQVLRTKLIPMITILWSNHGVGEYT